jgi:hypothetical protein
MATKNKPKAFSKRAMRIRISMIARASGLSDAEIAKAMNCGTSAVVAFAEKYDVSLDWLVCGDLKGLLRTGLAMRQQSN